MGMGVRILVIHQEWCLAVAGGLCTTIIDIPLLSD